MSKNLYNSYNYNSYKLNPIELLKRENSSLTKLYKEALLKMKKMQKDYELMYSKYVNENQIRENNIKNNYSQYQELLQQHFQKEENNYLEEIKHLKLQIQEKDKIINILQNNNALLNDKLSKNELIYNLKEKEYQKQLLNKDRLLMKSSDIVKKNSQEVMDDIRKLKEEIVYFQNKVNNNTCKEKVIEISNDNLNNMNYFNNEYKNQKIKKSLSSNNVSEPKYYKVFENSNEIHKLKIRIINLINIIKQKEKEINFWKNMRQNIYMSNTCQNIDNRSNKTYMNSYNNYRNVNSEQKIMKRCNSQTSSQYRQNKRKKINLYLVDSNINYKKKN